MLIVMAGLPGAGKSAAAEDIAVARDCAVLSVDPIEAALWRAGIDREQRRRLEGRTRAIQGFYEPSWQSVRHRRSAFDDWTDPRLVLDSMRPRELNTRIALEHLAGVDPASA